MYKNLSNDMNKKWQNDNENIMYGVNILDHAAVEKKFKQMKKRKRILTLISLLALAVLGFVIYDFWNVNFNEGMPIVALKESVEFGTEYTGISYNLVVCEDGKRILNDKKGTKCVKSSENETGENTTFKDVLYSALITYLKKEKVVNKDFKDLTINSFEFDEENDEEGSDYYVDLTYECKDGGSKCFKTLKERTNQNNVLLYVSLDKLNEVVYVDTFKSSGLQYEKLKADYKEKVINYFSETREYQSENVKSFDIELVANKGKYKYLGVVFEDLYEINISYMCVDDGNTCVTRLDDGNGHNLSFNAYMFLNKDNGIELIESIKLVHE